MKRKEKNNIQEEKSLEQIVSEYDKEIREKGTKKDKSKKAENNNQLKANKHYLKNIELCVLDLIPLKKPVDNGTTGIELVTGGFMNIYKINSFDYNSATDAELLTHIYSWDKYYRTFSNDGKIVAINMPVVVATNIQFYIHKFQKTDNPLYKEILNRYLREFREEMRDREDKEFYIFLFAKDYDDMLKINARFEGALVLNGFASEIEYERKIDVFKKYSNPYNNVLRPTIN